jgi:hypothetical protein
MAHLHPTAIGLRNLDPLEIGLRAIKRIALLNILMDLRALQVATVGSPVSRAMVNTEME